MATLRRLHLFEFGDQKWFPQLLREAETAYLAAMYRAFPSLSRRWAAKISTVLKPGESAEIVDLCSGSGGPVPLIVEELAKRGPAARATLTDLYPNGRLTEGPRIAWHADPVDATRVPSKLAGLRTMFSAFHHFRPDAAKAILKDAFDLRRPICVFEGGTGTLPGVLIMFLIPLHVLAVMPFVRPFRWTHLVFTYLIPILPLLILWDGIVSNIRIYSPEQLKQLTEDLRGPGYEWEIGRIPLPGIPAAAPYLLGRAS